MNRKKQQQKYVSKGSGGLRLARSWRWQYTLVIIVFALIGGFYVYKSFAATGGIAANSASMSGGQLVSKGTGGSYRILSPSNSTMIVNNISSPSTNHQVCIAYYGGAGSRKMSATYYINGRQRGSNLKSLSGNTPGELCVFVAAGTAGKGTLQVVHSGSGSTYIQRVFVK